MNDYNNPCNMRKICLSCGALLPEGKDYKCDICQQIELGLIDEEDAPVGYIG
ncbi:MAG: hypothetical protein HXL10_00500 [Candidatus Nanosynbacter sp.]|nr:hypothetical protein [Candidatus Nanosynbacter sp.]